MLKSVGKTNPRKLKQKPVNQNNVLALEFASAPGWARIIFLFLVVVAIGLVIAIASGFINSVMNLKSLKDQINELERNIKFQSPPQPPSVDRHQLEKLTTELQSDINNRVSDETVKRDLDNKTKALHREIANLPKTVLKTKEQLALEKDRIALEKDAANTLTAIIGSLVQFLGSLFFIVTAYFAYRNVKAVEEKQVTERFSTAIELLGNKDLEVRVGGIYALERVAKDSVDKDYTTVMDVLTCFLQQHSNSRWDDNSPHKSEARLAPPSIHIQAVLNVLARRLTNTEGQKIDLLILTNSDFSWMSVTEPDFETINLRGAKFSDSVLNKAKFKEADLTEADFTRADLTEADFTKAELTQADLRFAILADKSNPNPPDNKYTKSVILTEANLTKANLSGINLTSVENLKLYIQDTITGKPTTDSPSGDFVVTKFVDAKFVEEDSETLELTNQAQLQSSDLMYGDFSLADLRGVNLSSAKLQGANLTIAKLQGANLTGAKLQGANLTDAELQGANLTDAELQGANLTGAKLQGANLTGAKLQKADLTDADLSRATFSSDSLFSDRVNEKGKLINSAILKNTILEDVDLRMVQTLSSEQIMVAVVSDNVSLPDYLVVPEKPSTF